MQNGAPAQLRQRDLSPWPKYDAAVLGFRNYWYPVTWSRKIGKQPVAFTMLGDRIMFRREGGRVHAFFDQCPHRGIPLSVGRQEFPGTWTCRYHGWTFDNATGVLRAALTDGPDSPICGKVRVRTYPVEERAGLVWVWMGDGAPTVPVEEDLPVEFLAPNAIVVGRLTERKGSWRYAAENGFDEGHAKYLHRYGALQTLLRALPVWSMKKGGPVMDGPWLARPPDYEGYQGEFPGLGAFPRKIPWWKRVPQRRSGSPGGTTERQPGSVPRGTSVRLPGFLCSNPGSRTGLHFEWYVPTDAHHHRYLQFLVVHGGLRQAVAHHLRYWLRERWVFHVQFNGQDAWMVELMPESGPERLYRPDASITGWRRLCEHARGEDQAETPPTEESPEALAVIGQER
jgi:phenylpropionate dioxygenase-like ring-hydroxylating dioxygenase large terminal subunit